MELTIVNFVLTFDIHTFALETIWSIGISMVILGLVIWLPFEVILVLGLAIVLGHNSLDFYERKQNGQFSVAYNLLHRLGFFPLGGKFQIIDLISISFLVRLMMLGYCLGKVLRNDNRCIAKSF
jgi:uncharacterized membrane protein